MANYWAVLRFFVLRVFQNPSKQSEAAQRQEFFLTFKGLQGHAPQEHFENGTSQIG